jgi:hypothetical protein
LDNMNFLKRLQDNIERMNMQSSKPCVLDGQRVGPGVKSDKNLISSTTLSKNAEEALIQEKYEKSVTGQLHGDVDEGEIDKITEKYIEKMVDELFEGV